MSNLTLSGEANVSVSSSSHVYTPLIHGDEYFYDLSNNIYEKYVEQPPTKKRRNLPGNPDPNAEVIALSPNSLLAKNKFVCEICNKGFQRDQNLQLHRRGHNLPWKLKQRTSKDIRKKVYICPEVGCIHHDPLRALGDLTGVKKHFSRKHGEKKWKCDKCSKKYAVQSDWKAHSKTCGTREYRCDCGTLFTRKDSFITHTAFCEALAEESARSTPSNIPFLSSPRVAPPPLPPHHHQLPLWQSFAPPIHPIFSSPLDLNGFTNPQYELKTLDQNLNPFEHMPATALLQRAAQMGAKMSNNTSIFAPNMCSLEGTTGSVHVGGATMDAHSMLIQDIMANTLSSSSPSTFLPLEDRTNESTFCGLLSSKGDGDTSFHEEGMTRDFLGLTPITNNDFLSFIDHAQESWED